jgi:hypothetical protein
VVRIDRARPRSDLPVRARGRRPTPHPRPHVLDDIDAVSPEFGIPIDEDGLAGRECDFEDADGNRLRVATRRT